jgi:hypothetical protein
MRVPMTSGSGDPWHWWNMLRCCADFDKKLGVALVVTKEAQVTPRKSGNRAT